jgi:hypothetical protein
MFVLIEVLFTDMYRRQKVKEVLDQKGINILYQ